MTGGPVAARGENEHALLVTAEQGVRPSVVRLPRSVHGKGDKHGFVAQLVRMYRQAGTAMYVGDGTNCWPAVHVADAAHLFRLALEQAPAGTVLHAVGDEGIPVRTLTEALGQRLNLPTPPPPPVPENCWGGPRPTPGSSRTSPPDTTTAEASGRGPRGRTA